MFCGSIGGAFFEPGAVPWSEYPRNFQVANQHDQTQSQRHASAQESDPPHQLFLAPGDENKDEREQGRRENQGGHPHQIGFVHRRYFPVTSFTKYASGTNRTIAASARNKT